MIALFALTAAALAAAVAVAIRMDLPDRAERSLAALILWFALILVPIYALGYLGLLSRGALAASSAALFAGVLAASFRGVAREERKAHASRILADIRGIFMLPLDAIRVTASARSPAVAAVVLAFGLLLWSVVATYLAPSDSWDGIGYHEAIVGYSIQNRGFARVSVPNIFYFEAVNGIPRHCEMTSLWLVIFWDRRLIELPNTLAAPVFLLAVYVLCRRYGEDKSTSAGWASAALLMPGAVLLLRSTYIDLQVAAFVVAALHFATRPDFRPKDAFITSVALALMIGSKSMNAAWGPMLALVVLARLLAQIRRRPREVAFAIVGGLVIVFGLGFSFYLRNWIVFRNPLWSAAITIKSIGISFPGNLAFDALNMNQPIGAVWANMIAPFKPGHDFADTRVFGYGIAAPLLHLPLAAIAAALLLRDLAVNVARRVRKQPPPADAPLTWNFLLVAAFGLATAVLSPALWQARYNLHVAAVMVVACAWLSSTRALPRIGEAVMAATVFANFLYLFWANPGLLPKPNEMAKLIALSPVERAARRQNPWTLDPDVARRRDAALGPGSLLLYTDGPRFLGSLWNEGFSNRIEYISPTSTENVLKELDERKPKWFVTDTKSAVAAALDRQPLQWKRVGRMSAGSAVGSMAYERIDPTSP